jgi:PmbA protein
MQPADTPDMADLEQRVSDALALAREAGATGAEAALSGGEGLSVTVRMGEVETVEHDRSHTLGITVYAGRRKGTASTSDLSSGALRKAVDAALGIARHTAEDPCHDLPPAEHMARDWPDLDLWHPWELEVDAAVELARACEDAARGADPRISNSEGATVSRGTGVRVYGNTHGFLGSYRSSRHGLSCAVIARDEAGMQRDHWYTIARRAGDLEEATQVGRRAAERAVQRLGARAVASRRAPVVFAAEIASGLLGHFLGAVSGSNLYRRTSFLADGLGRQVFPEWLRLHEDPFLPRGMGSAPFDSEGVATRPRDLVAGGVLEGYVLDSYSACRLGMAPTGNAGGVHNLAVTTGERDLEGLLAEMGEGFLVTELMGMGVNLVTGDYSRGAAGYWVEDGAIVHPVQEVTVAGALPEMFRAIADIGRDVDARRAVRTGSILVDGMTIGGT